MKTDEKFCHLNMNEAADLNNEIRPKKAILTHFGFQVLKASPVHQAKKISEETGVNVVAAYDGMKMSFEDTHTLEHWI